MIIKLPSGKEIDAHVGTIGIDAELGVSTGYDERLTIPTPEDYDDDWFEVRFDAQDARDLADIMIARWQAFKSQHT